MEDTISVSVRNSSTLKPGGIDYGDGDGDALHEVARQLRWDLMRLSSLPPVEGRAQCYCNGEVAPSYFAMTGDALLLGICDSTALISQLAAAREVSNATISAAIKAKPQDQARLKVGAVRLMADITEAGLFIRCTAEFEWLVPAETEA